MSDNTEREALAALVAGVDPAVWALWCEEGLPSGVYRLRDEARATADCIIASDVWRNRAVQGSGNSAQNSNHSVKPADHQAGAPSAVDADRPLIALARTIASWDQGTDMSHRIPHWAVNLAMHLREKGYAARPVVDDAMADRLIDIVWSSPNRIAARAALLAALTPDGQEKNR